MRWAKPLFGLIVFLLAILAPDKLVALFLDVIGAGFLKDTWFGVILRNIFTGSAFSAGLSWLASGIKGIISRGDKD
ncbi:MAG: hypothetical protein DRJ43_05350 [Thermoprotei archaeon]|nr:MAG: hypothetical protein DRJ43_05350 [Thermoprotei archaeon]